MTGSEPDFDEKPAGEAEHEEEELDSQPDSEDPERDSEEPPEPVAQDRPQPDEDRWGIGSRVLALSALLGSAILVWTQFAFRSRWIADFLENNKLESSDQRGSLVAGFVGGLALGGALGPTLEFFETSDCDQGRIARGVAGLGASPEVGDQTVELAVALPVQFEQALQREVGAGLGQHDPRVALDQRFIAWTLGVAFAHLGRRPGRRRRLSRSRRRAGSP